VIRHASAAAADRAAAVPLAWLPRRRDRHGGGSVAAVGCTVLALATLPLMFVSADTPYALLGDVLFARGPGFGAAVQPTAAAAYALLDSLQVPRRSGTRSRGRGCWRL